MGCEPKPLARHRAPFIGVPVILLGLSPELICSSIFAGVLGATNEDLRHEVNRLSRKSEVCSGLALSQS
jgi:hypothetical protein